MQLPHFSLRSIGDELGLHVETFDGHLVVWAHWWRETLSYKSVFCQALVANNILSEAQMLRAVLRYRLGCSRSGGVIFWQIDQHEELYEGKIMYYRPDCHRDKAHHPDWVGSIIGRRYGWTGSSSRHCFFGLHQLSKNPFGYTTAVKTIDEKYKPIRVVGGDKTIAIVEAEKTAVIMSEAYPQYIWLACGGLNQLQPDKFRPLRGHNLILFPDTDTDGKAFKLWSDAAQTVQQQLFWEDSPPIYVSNLLEQKSSSDQKARKIDLADYYLETIRSSQKNSAIIQPKK